MKKDNIFILKDKINEARDITTLKFLPAKGKIFQFIPGQFVDVYFLDDRVGGQGKPYSISSIPQDKFLTITVKKIGRFSGALHDLKIGEKIQISAPQGYFYPEDEIKNIVFLAGGIGITPFYSIIKNYLSNGVKKNLFLFYSNKTKDDIAFLKKLSDLAKKRENFKVVYIITRERIKMPLAAKTEFKRINVKMLKKHLKNLDDKYYFICGSIGFVRNLWKELKSNNIKEEFIRVESFY